MSAWKLIDPDDRRTIPAAPGCYVVFSGKRPIYVGQSKNLRQRISQHRLSKVTDWSEIPWPPGWAKDLAVMVKVSARPGDEIILEARLIRRLHPTFNIVGNPAAQ